MDAWEAINTRRSVRKFTAQPVPDDLVRRLLQAAMMAPSACNAQPWHFLVVSDRGVLDEVSRINPNAEMARDAALAILVCGDLTLEVSAGYWVIDCAAAVENLLLAAHALGLGAVWTGIYPKQERMVGFSRLFGLPQHVVPHSLIPIGYPAERPPQPERFRADRVHHNRWQ